MDITNYSETTIYSAKGKLGYWIPRALHASDITVFVDNGLTLSFLMLRNNCLYGWEANTDKPTVVQLRDRDPSQFDAVIRMDRLLAEEDDVVFQVGDQFVKGIICGFHAWTHKSPVQVSVEKTIYDIHQSQILKWESSLDLES